VIDTHYYLTAALDFGESYFLATTDVSSAPDANSPVRGAEETP
jgi:hypothetical protein